MEQTRVARGEREVLWEHYAELEEAIDAGLTWRELALGMSAPGTLEENVLNSVRKSRHLPNHKKGSVFSIVEKVTSRLLSTSPELFSPTHNGL